MKGTDQITFEPISNLEARNNIIFCSFKTHSL
jgi:hypothetical protein